MGRSFASVRQALRHVKERWERTARQRCGKSRAAGEQLAGWATKHSSAAFFGCNGPTEAALFSVLVEMYRLQDLRSAPQGETPPGDRDVDP